MPLRLPRREGDRLGAAPVDLSSRLHAFFRWPADEEIDVPITDLCDTDGWPPPAHQMLRFVPAGLQRRAVPHFPFAQLDLLSLEPRASIILIYPPPQPSLWRSQKAASSTATLRR